MAIAIARLHGQGNFEYQPPASLPAPKPLAKTSVGTDLETKLVS